MRFRLRQLCLVARDLDRVADDLQAVFGLDACVRDLGVERHGLRNVVFPVGTSFLEVVSPAREGTTAGRYLERLGGDGGYMVILDGGGIDAKRRHVQSLGIRIALDADRGGYHALHLHPKDVGASMLTFDSDEEGDDLMGRWKPAGAAWKDHIRTDTVSRMLTAELQSPDPEVLGRRWSGILGKPLMPMGEAWSVDLDLGSLRFVADPDGRGETLGGIDLEVADAQGIVDTARARQLPTAHRQVQICGVRFNLIER